MKWLYRLIKHKHKWQHPLEKGEEEHGTNGTKRFCTKCGLEQWLYRDTIFYSLHWEDSPSEKRKDLFKRLKLSQKTPQSIDF